MNNLITTQDNLILLRLAPMIDDECFDDIEPAEMPPIRLEESEYGLTMT